MRRTGRGPWSSAAASPAQSRRLRSRLRAGWARGAQAALEADGRGPDVLQLVPGQQAGAELAAVGPETCVHFTNQWGDEIFLLRA